MRKRNDFDCLARDVAFEIVLGGDRFEPCDVAERLDGCSKAELDIFRDRVRYHSVDFAPPEYRTEDFIERMVTAWTKDIRTRTDRELADAGLRVVSVQAEEAARILDRGKWFRFSDGCRQCLKGTREAMWTAKDMTMLVSDEPVPANEVLRGRVDSLISRYGHEVQLDGPYDSMDISSVGLTDGAASMTIRRRVDILAQGVEGHQYYVVERAPGEMKVSNVMSFNPREADRLIGILETEESLRQSSTLVSERSPFPDGVLVGFPEPVRVSMARDDTGLFPFEVSSVFCTPDGRAMVSGRYLHQLRSDPEYNFPLSDLTDKGISDVRKTMDTAMRKTLAKLQGIETTPLDARRAPVRKAGPSL